MAGRRLCGRLGLGRLGLGLLGGAALGVQLGFERGNLRLQLFHFSGEAGRFGLRLFGHGDRVMMVMLHRLGLRNRPEAQHEKRAESGPAEKRGLARHVSDPF